MRTAKMTLTNASDKPWEVVGEQVTSRLDTKALLQQAGLDWTVTKTPTFTEFNGKRIDTGKKALVRESDGEILSMVSGNWNPVQNHEAFEFFNSFIDEGKMQMEAAGSLKGGQIVWALAKVDDSFELFNGDQVDGYMLFTNPHMFGKAIDVRFTPIRLTCSNMLARVLRDDVDHQVRVNHTSVFDPEAVKETLMAAHEQLEEYKDIAQFLGSKQITPATVQSFFNEVFPAQYKRKTTPNANDSDLRKNVELAMQTLDTQPGTEFAPGSWWQAYNAVTFMTDHVLGKSAETRVRSAWYGINQQRKLKALQKAIKYAEAA